MRAIFIPRPGLLLIKGNTYYVRDTSGDQFECSYGEDEFPRTWDVLCVETNPVVIPPIRPRRLTVRP